MRLHSEKNQRFASLLKDYEAQALGHPVDSEEEFIQARFWMAERWPLPETIYSSHLSHEEFLPITSGQRRYFGGNQAWFSRQHHRNAGCGTVAIADITAYAAFHGGLPALYAGGDGRQPCSKEDLTRHMEAVVEDLYPTPFGIPCVLYLTRGADRYAERRGCPVAHWHSLHGRYSSGDQRLRAEAFLQYNILSNRPVACIHWSGVRNIPVLNPREVPEGSTADMNWHWVVVTDIERSDGAVRLTVSSCGLKYIFTLEDFLQGGPSFVTPEFAQPSRGAQEKTT